MKNRIANYISIVIIFVCAGVQLGYAFGIGIMRGLSLGVGTMLGMAGIWMLYHHLKDSE